MPTVPSAGPEPVLISRKQVDALYEILEAVVEALQRLDVSYVVTGGSLLGAVRQHSILFCDDDIDIAILEVDSYEKVRKQLQGLLGTNFTYTINAWEGGDRVRLQRVSNIFLDVFCIRKYESEQDLRSVIGIKRNGQAQSEDYVSSILDTIQSAGFSQDETTPLFPCWHFSARKAVELWPKEVYRTAELLPVSSDYKLGPLDKICGPRMPVLLLKRAFGQDCFDVYYQSGSHGNANSDHHQQDSNELKPVVLSGGTWEGGQKLPLQPEHYIPLQPISRAKRRPTLHCRERLMEYLREQSAREADLKTEMLEKHLATPKTNVTVYMDGVFDLFHVGHLEAIRQCASLGSRVVIGVTGDKDAADYKRPPILSQENRIAIVGAIQYVDKVICPCPLVVTEEFMEEQKIDLVVHGFANDEDAAKQKVFFETPMRMGRFQRISYYDGLSTTDIIHKIQSLRDESTPNSKWFGASLAAATCNSPDIPTDPFPLELREVVEPHIRKATLRRTQALGAVRKASGFSECEFKKMLNSPLAIERDFDFDVERHPLLSAFIRCGGLPSGMDLTHLHQNLVENAKDSLLMALTSNRHEFQRVYDDFVLTVCAPRMASLHECGGKIYYQAFPCIRIVQPGEFSIGPHADVAYGHHPCSINFYLPFTRIGGAASLFLESRPGSEDWHPITGHYGNVKQFAGATCLHWTTDNTTDYTRVSIDFRLIAGSMFHRLACGGSEEGGRTDVFRKSPGYYSCCRRENGAWVREGKLLPPDARFGFPWTVKNWDKYRNKKTKIESDSQIRQGNSCRMPSG